ncbi:MAG: ABC transporter ATP-binding protein/permease [Bacilli bacterium]|nr:ABC transporter ATP-binding protein/permease [Bacilli bacterium]
MIKLENVEKYFNKNKKNEIHVINNTSLILDNNGLVALLGNSGSGKTTLLNVIGGLDKINKGKIYINNKKITRFRTSKIDEIRTMNIGYIFQNYNLLDNLTVYENVALVLKMIGIKDKLEIKKRVDYILNTVGIYKYKNRLASMLSGGERQRVGIARAIVKNPNIIIADEPTGNLDSKNSLEIMNIIKAISKDKLVILVTHEKDLANFYASRIIEIVDGKITSDKNNDHDEDLDYKIDNKIYLKDMQNHEQIKNNNINIDYYNDNKEKLNLKIVVKNNNIYLECNDNFNLIDNSNIELIDDNYKKISKESYLKYQFDFNQIINNNVKIKYASIYNPITLLINGFKRIFNYSILKKILLLGFLVSAIFITYAISNIFGITNIKDDDFVKTNKNYLNIKLNNIDLNNYLNYEKLEYINYIIPGDSNVVFNIKYDNYYQTYNTRQLLRGSLSTLNMITNDDLIYGKMPENDYEIVVDKKCLNSLFDEYIPQQLGINDVQGFLNKEISIKNLDSFKIVGITDLSSPSIYTKETNFINILSNSSSEGSYFEETATGNIINYDIVKNKIEIKKGRMPENDYEVIINISSFTEDNNLLNKLLDIKINNVKLKVVGYYYDKYNKENYYVNSNTIKYKLIDDNNEITIYANNKQETINYFKENNINIQDSYLKDKNEYKKDIQNEIMATLIVALIIIGISLIEIYLMIRASFLSRIKEIGILRAIGVKKVDIYKMFLGEILAISISTGVTGILFMTYILSNLTNVSKIFEKQFLVNEITILISFILFFMFNIIVGLLPVFNTLRKTPAQILSRNDVD